MLTALGEHGRTADQTMLTQSGEHATRLGSRDFEFTWVAQLVERLPEEQEVSSVRPRPQVLLQAVWRPASPHKAGSPVRFRGLQMSS